MVGTIYHKGKILLELYLSQRGYMEMITRRLKLWLIQLTSKSLVVVDRIDIEFFEVLFKAQPKSVYNQNNK
jgi:hypothetical protein